MIAKVVRFTLAILSLAPLTYAFAVPIAVTSYDMRNGDGLAFGGSFNYWDLEYDGAGNTALDGAPLSGGTGNLTDGVITTQSWINVENLAGTGPYVGWVRDNGADPVIRFQFAGAVPISSVTIHMDDSNGLGGVEPAASVGISSDGLTYTTTAITDPAAGDPFALTLPVGFTSDAVYIQLTHRTLPWIFVDEISFDAGTSAVPEPGVLALLSFGVLGAAALRRRRTLADVARNRCPR